MDRDARVSRPAAQVAFATFLLLALTGIVPAGDARASPQSALWLARYDGPGHQNDTALAAVVSPDGATVYLTGWSTGATTYADYATIAYDSATGAPRWLRRFNGSGNDTDVATSIAVSPDGTSVFVTGYSYQPAYGDEEYVTFAYDSAMGSVRWKRTYDGPNDDGIDEAYALAVSPDGSTVFGTGKSAGPTGYWDYATLAYDAVTGSPRWLRRYDGPTGNSDSAYAIGVSTDGSTVYVAGGSGGDFATLAYDALSGSTRWRRRYDGPAHAGDEAAALVVSPDGSRLFVTGWTTGRRTSYDYATIAYDEATGTRLWVRRYARRLTILDNATSVGVAPDGSKVFVTGVSQGVHSSYDFETVAYDAATGSPVWSARFNGPGGSTDEATRLAVMPDGSRVFVTGWTTGTSGDTDYTTLSYDAATGALLDVQPYDGPGQGTDQANVVVLSPDGSKWFVTGSSQQSVGDADFATLAYGT